MPTGATTVSPPAAKPNQQGKAPTGPIVPFTRAAKEHIEPFVDESIVMTAATQARGPFDVPAYGFLRAILLFVQATGGAAGGGNVTAGFEDAPWNVFQEVALNDVNGAPIVGPISGYDLYLINKYGGYKFLSDPRQQQTFSAIAAGANASGNFAFTLRIPVEVNGRDALGALSNQNASSTYKVRWTLNASTTIYTVTPNTTLPTIRVRAYLEAWSQPPANDLRGNAQATTPPADKTTAYWSKFVPVIAAGQQTIRFNRVGNYIRMIIFVIRDNTPTRAAGAPNWPDPSQISWDTRLLHNFTTAIWKLYISERYGFSAAAEAAGGIDNGVFIYDWAHEFDQHVGQELRDGWLPTVQSTRLELQGVFGGAGSVEVITNDIAPAGEVFVS